MCSLLHTPCCLIHCNNFLLYAAWIFRREEILHLRPLGFLCFLLTDVCYIHYANIPASIFPESSIWRGLLALISGAFQTSASSSPLCCVLNYSWVARMFVCCIWDEAWILNEVDCNLNLYLDLAVFLLDENSFSLISAQWCNQLAFCGADQKRCNSVFPYCDGETTCLQG